MWLQVQAAWLGFSIIAQKLTFNNAKGFDAVSNIKH